MEQNKLYIKLVTKNPEYYSLFVNGEKMRPNICGKYLDTEIVCDSSPTKTIIVKKEVSFLKQNNWKRNLAKFWIHNIPVGFYNKESFVESEIELNTYSIHNGQVVLKANKKADYKFEIEGQNLDYDVIRNVIRIDYELKRRFAYYMKLKKIIIVSLIALLILAILRSVF